MFRPCEDADEPAEHELETVLLARRWELGHRRLFSNDDLQLRHEIHHELTIGSQRFTQPLTPCVQLGFALAEKLPDKALEGLGQGGVGNVAFVLVKLAGRKEAARWNENLVQLIHHG